jgi:tetratricopeptide (TPR) repeat protein
VHLGRHDEALEHLRRGVAISAEIGEAELEAAALNDLAATLRATRRSREANATYRAAHARAEQLGDRYQQARALDGLALLGQDDGDRQGSRQRWRQAMTMYDDLGVPEAEEIRRRLNTTESPGLAGSRVCATQNPSPSGPYSTVHS